MRAVPKDSVKVKGNLTHLAKKNSQSQANSLQYLCYHRSILIVSS